VAVEVNDNHFERMLDIGTGTGLLSLMIAQVNNAKIDAVEIDRDAFDQAAENFQASPWSARLKAHHSSINEFQPPYKYDLIFSNPPFYENDLKSDDEKRNVALHSSALDLTGLFVCAERLIMQGGGLAILIPYRRVGFFEERVETSKFSITQKVKVKQTPAHDYFRCMYMLKHGTANGVTEKEIVIRENQSTNAYSDEFYSLIGDYYL
jgi:tRNA1Val (adenine37-N6)-methyltransferase